MQLHTARLCLDCQEVHEEQTCPVCGSESFAYISRWIPAPERRATPRPAAEPPEADTYRRLLYPERNQPPASRWLKRGAFGIAAVSAAAWMLKRNADTDKNAAASGDDPSNDRMDDGNKREIKPG
jgi:predicted  nucleic acid-binding Zn-ribbon protein